MPASKVMLTVLSGTFSNQANAFRHLQAEAADFDIDVFPREADVIGEAREVRLAHYFRPAIVARIEKACDMDNTIIVLLPSRLSALPHFPSGDRGLRLLGRYAGILQSPD